MVERDGVLSAVLRRESRVGNKQKLDGVFKGELDVEGCLVGRRSALDHVRVDTGKKREFSLHFGGKGGCGFDDLCFLAILLGWGLSFAR